MHSFANHDQIFGELQSTSENKEWIYKQLADKLTIRRSKIYTRLYRWRKEIEKTNFFIFYHEEQHYIQIFARILNYCKDYIDCLFKHINVAINQEAITSSKLTQVTGLLAIMSKSKNKFCMLNKHCEELYKRIRCKQ